VLVHDVRAEAAQQLARESGSESVPMERLLAEADIIILAVKPQVLPALYATLSSRPGKDWISMAAGVSLETLAASLGTTQVVRIMPNIAASEGKAVTAVAPHPDASGRLVEEALSFVRSFGSAHLIDQRLFGAFIGISGSAIATVFAFLHGMAMGGVREGLSYAKALELIGDTTEGAIALARATGRHPEELMTQVCSPGGTTIESMKVLAENSFTGVLMESVSAASGRAMELEAKAKQGT
jgi:pyrroline-5-carboxylate reductase